MNKSAWSVDDLNEYDALVEAALREPVVADRRTVFLDGLDNALAAHACGPVECWAFHVNADIRNDGADRILKREQERRRARVAVAHNGQVLGRAPREMGHKVRNDQGETVHQRTLFDFMTWDELREKRAEFARAERAARVDRAAVEKLLTLEERVPGAANPAEACDQIGTSVVDFLAEAV